MSPMLPMARNLPHSNAGTTREYRSHILGKLTSTSRKTDLNFLERRTLFRMFKGTVSFAVN